jgi:hypothetical protein
MEKLFIKTDRMNSGYKIEVYNKLDQKELQLSGLK